MNTSVIFWRVSCGNNDPAFWNRLISKCFTLQKLKHCWREGFRNAVNFINKKDTFFFAGFLHVLINTVDDFAHCILCYRVRFAIKCFFFDEGQTNGTLSCVMGNGIRNKTDIAFLGNLLHNLCFSDSGRTHQQDRTLTNGRDAVLSVVVFF